ncbi:MAG: diacylglycerol kinase family lipid kinase [Actinomycetota bacterium]|nr:diacylglycerol kinase family lipid kinase [Actinomycetota bacterium]
MASHFGPLVVIANPRAGRGRVGAEMPELERQLNARKLRYRIVETTGPGHAAEIARDALHGGERFLVAVGGDGTVHEVVNGLLGSETGSSVELAVLPRGTGVDFVRTFGIPTDLDGAIGVARDGAVRLVDLGHARYVSSDGGAGEAYFANFAGAGMSGAIARRANASSKALGGRLSFLWATVAVFSRWRGVAARVTVDEKEHSRRVFEVLVTNGQYAAGGMWVTPDAEPDDGLFDVLVIGDVTKADFVATFPKIYRGRHIGHPKIELLRGREVSVETPAPLPIALDGEQPGTTPATFTVVPNALRLRVRA